MSTAPTRRQALLGSAAFSLSLGGLLMPGSAFACHTYKSPVDGRVGCGPQKRDLTNGVSGGSTSTPGSPDCAPSSPVSELKSPPPASGNVPAGYVLAWSDEFDSLSLGAQERWAPYFVGWNVRHLAGNNDAAVKVADDETLQGGVLKAGDLLRQSGRWGSRSRYLHEVSGGQLALRGYPVSDAHRAAFWGFPYVASMISGQKSFAQRYGYWETRVRMTNVSKGHHFAIWLLPDDNAWPPEIDLLEVVGQHQDLIFTNSHGSGRGMSTHRVPSISSDWYTVGFLWTSTTMRWTINDKIVREHPNYITSKKLYMLMSWEIGGKWPGTPDASTKWPAEVLVDYVRIYRPGSSS
jgi:hypothetical protein